MTSRKIALRENIATLPTLLNCFYYFMYRTKSGPHMLTYFKSTKPILSRQTWKIHTEMHFSSLERNSAGVGEFFGLLKKQLLLQSRKKRREEEELSSSFFSYDTSIIPKFNAPRKWYEKSKQKGRDGSGNPIGLEKRITWNRFLFQQHCLSSSLHHILSCFAHRHSSLRSNKKTWFAWWTMRRFFFVPGLGSNIIVNILWWGRICGDFCNQLKDFSFNCRASSSWVVCKAKNPTQLHSLIFQRELKAFSFCSRVCN